MAGERLLFSCLSAGSSFCRACGSLLKLPEVNPIVCDSCGMQTSYEELANLEIVTRSKLREPSPALLRAQPGRENREADLETQASRHRQTVDEPCPKCGHHQLEFYTMQLRSADEGQTVFYECVKCGHKFSQNN